jgi:hypothetical protein
MYGTLISTQTLASNTVSVTFSSIPATYTDLIIVCSLRDASAGTEGKFAMVLNGDIGANYSDRLLLGSGSATSSITNASTTYMLFDAGTPGGGASNNIFGNAIITIPNYAGSTTKVVSVDAVSENASTASTAAIIGGVWNSTAAINAVMIRGVSNNLVTGSTISLYGLTHF